MWRSFLSKKGYWSCVESLNRYGQVGHQLELYSTVLAKNYQFIKTCLGAEWDSFLASSPDSSIFLTSTYLRNAGVPLGLYAVYNSNELRALVALAENSDGSAAVSDDLIVYSGLCLGSPALNQVHSQTLSERHEITYFVAEQLALIYRNINFSLSPSITDIRPFLWYNYGQEQERYLIDVRYTSYLSISDFRSATKNEDIGVYNKASVARRQQIRYARRDGVFTEEFQDVTVFIDFYRKTMARQGENLEDSKIERMRELVDKLLATGHARMYGARTSKGDLGSVAVFGIDTLRAYYLFGANDPEFRNTPTGTSVLWDAFFSLSSLGVEEVDMEGVNSPRRGWFKLSFGGDLRPYYQVCMCNP